MAYVAPLDLGSVIGLGVLQGIAEFLPISSSGHLAMAQALLGVRSDQGGHTLNVLLHGGTLIAVLWTYRREVGQLLIALVAPRKHPQAFAYGLRLVVATLPLVVVLLPAVEAGVLQMEGNIQAIGVAFWITGGLLAAAHYKTRRAQSPTVATDSTFDVPSWRQAMLIGLAQLIAVLPGISRAGSTIAAGLMVGLNRPAAARFSFLLSVPAVMGACLLEAMHLFERSQAPLFMPVSVGLGGFATSLVVGLATLRWLLRLLNRLGPLPFVPYLALLGLLAVWLGAR